MRRAEASRADSITRVPCKAGHSRQQGSTLVIQVVVASSPSGRDLDGLQVDTQSIFEGEYPPGDMPCFYAVFAFQLLSAAFNALFAFQLLSAAFNALFAFQLMLFAFNSHCRHCLLQPADTLPREGRWGRPHCRRAASPTEEARRVAGGWGGWP